MSCSRRTYLPDPDLTGGGLPSVPTSPNNWGGIVELLQSICGTLENPEAQAPTPGPVPNFALTTYTGGVALTWDSARDVFSSGSRSGAYILYKGETNDFSQAKALVTPHQKNARSFRWFDKWGQAPTGTQRFYWVRALNQKGARNIVEFNFGPLAGPLVTEEP